MIKLKSLYNEIQIVSSKEKDKIENTLLIMIKKYNVSREMAIHMLKTSGAPELKKKMKLYYPENA